MILVYNTLEQTQGVHSILKNIWQPTVQAKCSPALFCLVVIVRLPWRKLSVLRIPYILVSGLKPSQYTKNGNHPWPPFILRFLSRGFARGACTYLIG